MMRHDPEQQAAAYLAGEMNRLARARFARHLLDCPDCWQETRTARDGRILAETLREVAPAELRDRLRAIPGSASAPPRPHPRRWRPVLTVGLFAAALVVLVAVLLPGGPADQPAPLAAAVRIYRAGQPEGGRTGSPPVRAIGSYTWRGTTTRDLAGVPAIVHTFTDPAGRRILVLSSATPFPRAAGAHDVDPAPAWTVRVDGATLLCADRDGTSWLAVATTDAQTRAAGRALRLT